MRNENKETNQGKKAIGESMGSRIVLALIVVAVIVTAAKVIPLVRNRVQTSQYPVIELADLQGMELESLSDGKFSFSYPAEDWEVWEQVTTDYHPLTIFYKGTADDGSTSISVAENDTVVTQLKPELLQVMCSSAKLPLQATSTLKPSSCRVTWIWFATNWWMWISTSTKMQSRLT